MDISPPEEFNLIEKKETPEEGKMSPVKYYTIMRKSKDPRWIRYEMVRYAKEEGVKPAARVFSTTPKTVRKWLRRWQPGSLRGLEDQSKAPKSKGSGIDPDQRQKAIELKRKLKSWGGLRIKREFNLSLSDKAIRKIWKEEGLLKKKRRKHPKAYAKWTEEEDIRLRAEYAQGKTINELAEVFQRQPSAIRSRLQKLRLL